MKKMMIIKNLERYYLY